MKSILVTMLIMGVLTLASRANALLYEGHNYVFVKSTKISWDDATKDIHNTLGTGYHLATINSLGEHQFLAENSVSPRLTGEYWLGGFQSDDGTAKDNWKWVTGEKWDYTNWAKGEANDFYGSNSEQHLAMWSRMNWEWNDEGYLGNISGYIAEMAPVPEPATMLLFGTGLIGLAGAVRRKKK